MAVNHVDEKNFDKEVRESEIPVVVDFYADWCNPCKMMEPIFEEVSGKFDGKVKFAKLDVDANQDLSQEFGVMSIPTMIIFKDGKPVETMSGVQDEDSLVETINSVK